jgi:hypothetical protein
VNEWCVYCGEDEAQVEIVLSEGQVLYSHRDCLAGAIRENASTDNPVHSISDGEEEIQL